MKNIFLLIQFISFFLYITPQVSVAQNLVPNPSFEDYTECPNGQCQITYATGWEIYSLTPDYFNSCASSWSVPSNPAGYQNAATGNAYVGMGCYDASGANVREYIGIELSSSLIVGNEYQVKIKVVPSEKPVYGYFCNNLGVIFSTVSFAYQCDQLTPNLLPQNMANIYSTEIISDTVNWTTISGTFTADSVYQYIVIGNFFDDSNAQFSAFDSNGFGAYYFVDDIEVYPDTIVDTTSINQNIKENNISVFPNPANDKIYFHSKGNNPFKISLYSQYGILIKEQTLHKSEIYVSTCEIQDGIYFLQMHSNDFTINKKVIIQH